MDYDSNQNFTESSISNGLNQEEFNYFNHSNLEDLELHDLEIDFPVAENDMMHDLLLSSTKETHVRNGNTLTEGNAR